MSLSFPTLNLIKNILEKLGPRDMPIKLLSLGYPDLLLTTEHVAQIFGPDIVPRLQFREDSPRIIAWHSLQGKLDKVIDAKHLLSLLNIELFSIDIVKDRGDEIIVDLNEPLPPEMEGVYDIVIDGGTTEHCFNIGQAIKNVALLARVGGFIIQGNGLNNYNHGFYGINPTCYYDFYTQNSYAIMFMSGFSRLKSPMMPEMFQVPATGGFHSVPELTGVLMVAQRTGDRPIVWPMQSKYLNARKAS